MATDPRKLRPNELCRLLNSTPLGEVVTEQQLRNHRTRAGLRIGEGNHIDLVRYVAWLVQKRHASPAKNDAKAEAMAAALSEAAEGAAALGSAQQEQQLTSKQESLLAALLTEPNCTAAATKAGICRATAYRWLKLPEFRAAYRVARRDLVEFTVGRIQTASGQAVDALINVTNQGRRDGDRVRAAVAILDRAMSGLTDADILYGDPPAGETAPLDTEGVVKLISARLRKLDQAALPTAEKSRLTATLADALLRAIGVDVLDKRLEALQSVLSGRKDKKK